MTQYAALYNDRGLTGVYAVFRQGQLVWNGTGFVTYVNGSDNLYANVMLDPYNQGYYTVTFPVGIVAQGSYPFTVYLQSGVYPDLTIDIQLGSSNIEIPQSLAITVPDLVLRLRLLANDYPDSNKIYFETGKLPKSPDGSQLFFKLQNSNITPGTVYASYESNVRTQGGFVVNYQDGIVTFSLAPALGSELTFDYTYQFSTDTDYQEFLNEAAEILGFTTASSVDSGLIPALLQFGLYNFFIKRASSYAYRFASSGGIASEAVSTVTGEYQKLADIAQKRGTSLMNNFYTRAGRQKSPAFGQTRVHVDPYTPKR